MTLLSYTRGAWLAALIGLVYVPRACGQTQVGVAGPASLGRGVGCCRLGRERLFSDIGEGGLGGAISTGQLGTGRLGLWQAMLEEARTEPIFGHGFGFTFSQGSVDWFGFEGNFGTGSFVYPHNDLLFWLSGVRSDRLLPCTPASGWRCGPSTVDLSPIPDAAVRHDALLLSGVFTAMLVATLTANGIFVYPVAGRFFVASGVLFALARSASPRREHMTEISVLTPSYGYGRFLGDCLDSRDRAGIRAIQHFIQDGGSEDETLDVLRSFGDRDPLGVSARSRVNRMR